MLHLVRVCKPTFHSKQAWILTGSYLEGGRNQLQFVNPDRYYYSLYYVDVPNGIAPICASYKSPLIFIKNQSVSGGVRMWFYKDKYDSKSTNIPDEAILYIYDLYANHQIGNNAGLKTWDEQGNLTFISQSQPLDIHHEVQFAYNLENKKNLYLSGEPRYLFKVFEVDAPFVSEKRQLDANRKYATLLHAPMVLRRVDNSIDTDYYVESYSGYDGGVYAFFALSAFSERRGLSRGHWQPFSNHPIKLGGQLLTHTPPILCIDVTDLPTSFN